MILLICFLSYFWAPECSPDLSDPMSVANYATEEMAEVKDAVFQQFSDKDGMTSLTATVIISISIVISIYMSLILLDNSLV